MIKVYHSDQHKVACILNTETEEILTAIILPILNPSNQVEKYHLIISSSNDDNIMSVYYSGDFTNIEVNASYDETTEMIDICVSANDHNYHVEYRLHKDYIGESSKIAYGEMIDNFLNNGKTDYKNEVVKPTDIIKYVKNTKDNKEIAESNFFKLLNSTKKKNPDK